MTEPKIHDVLIIGSGAAGLGSALALPADYDVAVVSKGRLAQGGIASALVSLPNRYMHSPVEVVSLKDLELIPQLLAAFAQSIKAGEQFKVKI